MWKRTEDKWDPLSDKRFALFDQTEIKIRNFDSFEMQSPY